MDSFHSWFVFIVKAVTLSALSSLFLFHALIFFNLCDFSEWSIFDENKTRVHRCHIISLRPIGYRKEDVKELNTARYQRSFRNHNPRYVHKYGIKLQAQNISLLRTHRVTNRMTNRIVQKMKSIMHCFLINWNLVPPLEMTLEYDWVKMAAKIESCPKTKDKKLYFSKQILTNLGYTWTNFHAFASRILCVCFTDVPVRGVLMVPNCE